MDLNTVTVEEYVKACEEFSSISKRLNDDWLYHEDKVDAFKSFLKKETYITTEDNRLLKAEYIIFYNLSYGVPSFSFNMWNSRGVLITLDEIRTMTLIHLEEKEFYSVITQQEHPIFFCPYFIMHPCQTERLLALFKNNTKNIIVTFLSLISPLIRLNLPLEYGL